MLAEDDDLEEGSCWCRGSSCDSSMVVELRWNSPRKILKVWVDRGEKNEFERGRPNVRSGRWGRRRSCGHWLLFVSLDVNLSRCWYKFNIFKDDGNYFLHESFIREFNHLLSNFSSKIFIPASSVWNWFKKKKVKGIVNDCGNVYCYRITSREGNKNLEERNSGSKTPIFFEFFQQMQSEKWNSINLNKKHFNKGKPICFFFFFFIVFNVNSRPNLVF